MKENLKKVFLFTLTVLFIFSMIGCERSNTVASFVVSDRQYTEPKGAIWKKRRSPNS
mgnify:CR=1 FL=1